MNISAMAKPVSGLVVEPRFCCSDTLHCDDDFICMAANWLD